MTSRATLFFEPLDVLQFRDHRPFDAGYHVAAGTVFPMPSVFLGCLRTALLREQGARFGSEDFGLTEPWARELLGTSRAPGTLTLRGPLFARLIDGRVEPLLPPPLDIASTDATEGQVQILRPFRPAARRLHGASGALCEGDVPWTGGDVKKADEHRLFTVTGARQYLAAGAGARLDLDEAHVIPASKVYVYEQRVGIIRNDERLTADDRMLYVTRPFRLAPGAGFAVDVELPGGPADEAIQRLDGMVVPLGGKAHRARICYFAGSLIPDELAADGATAAGLRKLWLITPLVLGMGGAAWPTGVACTASERTVLVGGFDMARRAPKPLRRALLVGTVLTIEGLAPTEALAALAGAAWKDDRRAGYGVALAGKGTKNP